MLNVIKTPLSGALIIEPKRFADERGYFWVTFQAQDYKALGLPTFVQDNSSRSVKNVIRGLHYQLPSAQGKLVWVTQGTIWDVIVDIRKSSATFGEWFSVILSEENHKQVYVPAGFAHGFCVLSDIADFHYKCTDYYQPRAERGIIWNDAELNIPWPTETPILSPKDQIYPALGRINEDDLFA